VLTAVLRVFFQCILSFVFPRSWPTLVYPAAASTFASLRGRFPSLCPWAPAPWGGLSQGRRRGEQLDAPHIAEALGRLSAEQSDTILVAEVKLPGIFLLVSTTLREALTSQSALNI
jgi:hypothetical protein